MSRSLLRRGHVSLVIITRQEDKTPTIETTPTSVYGERRLSREGVARILRDTRRLHSSNGSQRHIDLSDNVLVLSLIQGGEVLASARRLARQVFGDFSRPDTGVLFVLPVADAEGLASLPDVTPPRSTRQTPIS